jgi:recombination protein RecA
MLVRSAAVGMIVIDSVAALTPRAEIEGDMGDSHMGLQARLLSQALRKLTGSIQKSNTLVVFINQLRMKIGVMFGNPLCRIHEKYRSANDRCYNVLLVA